MKKFKITLLIVIVASLMFATVAPAGADSRISDLAGWVEAGGGQLYVLPEPQAVPLAFEDYPETFDAGLLTWDNDMIDAEHVAGNGSGVYVAILDTGLKRNWREYFPEERVATELGRSFVDTGVMRDANTGEYVPNVVESRDFTGAHPHGTHVTSTVIGYSFYGLPIQGVASGATIIPVRVLETYDGLKATFGTDASVAAGINYIAGLAEANPGNSYVINMSLGSLSNISTIEQDAVDRAIAAGVIVVASAGNEGTAGMGSPGSYPPVISVGASGWALDLATCTGEWVVPPCAVTGGWWTQDVPENTSAAVSYITDFSSRERLDLGFTYQELDVVAPGSWVVGPYPIGAGQSRLPNWANGQGNGVGGQYYFLGGTSMAAPHVAGVAALMLEANPNLTQADVEAILRSTADTLPFAGGQLVFDINLFGITLVTWGTDGFDAVGWGLVQADAAVSAAP